MLANTCSCKNPRVILTLMAIAYFFAFPADLEYLIAWLPRFIDLLGTVLKLSNDISPWLYGLAGVSFLAITITRIWGKNRTAE